MAQRIKTLIVGSLTTCVVGAGGLALAPAAQAVAPASAVAPGSVSMTALALAPAAKSNPKFVSSHARVGKTNSKSVKRLQQRLISRKAATKGLRSAGPTGSYYKQTKKSVRKWQKKLGYSGAGADGILGQSSATALGLRWVVKGRTTSSVGASPSPTSNQGGALSPNQLKSVLKSAGFREPAIRTAYGIAMRESRGYPGVASQPNSNGTRDHGLFQINDVHRSYIDFTYIYDAVYNARVAFNMSAGGTDFSHWGIGTKGWAGTLKKQSPAYWQMLQDEMERFKAQYPG